MSLHSTVQMGEMDFETYSEAGYEWVPPHQVYDAAKGKVKDVGGKWRSAAGQGKQKKGLSVVGAAAYAEHPSTDILTFSYKLPAWWPGGGEVKRWAPGLPNPQELFDYLAAGGIIRAHNAMFERLIWAHVAVRKYGWPELEPYRYQMRCSMATARVNCLPGPLGALGEVLKLPLQKDADGKRLLDKFSMPRSPTKQDPRTRIRPEDDPADFEKLQAYCDGDVLAEESAGENMQPMSADELLFWWVDQEINWRGIGIDRAGVENCQAILEQALERYGEEYRQITGGLEPTQLEASKGWLYARGVFMGSMDADAVEEALKRALPPDARRVLEIRQLIGSASVKKLYGMALQASRDDRLRNLIVHHGARTGRPTGDGVQPLNLPKSGPELKWCDAPACARPFGAHHKDCPWCRAPAEHIKPKEWSAAGCETVLWVMSTRDLSTVEYYFGDAVLCISGVLRGLFQAGPGMELIASDYSAIEAVVTAMLSRCEWRIQAFRDNKPIYLLSASKITGTPLETYEAYKAETGSHHPDRQKIGKVAELGLGFGGWLNAWRVFDDTDTFTDEDVKRLILGWRDASPEIPELWGGQTRGAPWDKHRRQEFYGFEGAAVQAILYPGWAFEVAGVKFYMRGYEPDVYEEGPPEVDYFLYGDYEPRPTRKLVKAGKPGALIVRLLSGRELTYHAPQLSPSTRPGAATWEHSITYMTWNSNPKYGPPGWVPMSTFGGRLTENIVQATAHDILRFAILNLRAAGYPTVLHVYDEIVVEVPVGLGSVEEVERIMAIMPPWAEGWPVRAAGGWRGKRYRKD